MSAISRLSVEEALGYRPEANDRGNASLCRVPADFDTLVKLTTYWSGLPAEKLPNLCGITISPGEESRVLLNVVLDQGGVGPFLCIEADLPRDRVIPDFSLIWPYAGWWQEELAVFFDVRFDRKNAREGITWRRA